MGEALSIILGIVGLALLAIGAVLALTMANLPLGLGLMAIGAVALGSSIAANWDKIPDQVRQVISDMLAFLSVAFLVLGAILTFTMANLALGLGLIALGAVTMTAATAIDWDKLSEETRAVVQAIMRIVGTAFLVIGAILAFTAVNLPLGVALIAIGAAMLVASVALDWNKLPKSVQDTVSILLGIVGGALIVIGIILCVTGVGIPIGIACILAGIGSMVAAVALNWDFIVDKVREVWEGVKSYWHNNIERVFTLDFWKGIFKSIINGLIWVINQGIYATDHFINSIAGGIGDLLNFFGVEGWGFSISLPKIPYLAQGAVIPPNREFLAVLGDQSHGNNIETPEALMRQVVREEAGQLIAEAIMAMGNIGGGTSSQGDVVLMVGHTELARATVRGLRDLKSSGELGGLELAFS